jgi:hypothetical protein
VHERPFSPFFWVAREPDGRITPFDERGHIEEMRNRMELVVMDRTEAV